MFPLRPPPMLGDLLERLTVAAAICMLLLLLALPVMYGAGQVSEEDSRFVGWYLLAVWLYFLPWSLVLIIPLVLLVWFFWHACVWVDETCGIVWSLLRSARLIVTLRRRGYRWMTWKDAAQLDLLAGEEVHNLPSARELATLTDYRCRSVAGLVAALRRYRF